MPFAGARVLLGRAARDVAPDGPARLGVLALEGALPDPSGPGSRGDAVVHALWWLIVELADERPLALVSRRRPVGRRADARTAAHWRHGARPSCRSRSWSPRGRRRAGHAACRRSPPSARSCGSSRRRSPRPARHGWSRRCSGVRGRWRSSRARVRRPAATRCISASCSRTRGGDALERRPFAATAGAARRGPARPAHARRDRPRARGRGAGSRRRRAAGTHARRARAVRGDRRRGGAARRARARRRSNTASRTRWSPRRRARRSARWTPPSCTLARPRCSPARGSTTSASPST